jgi:hypothetical protein
VPAAVSAASPVPGASPSAAELRVGAGAAGVPAVAAAAGAAPAAINGTDGAVLAADAARFRADHDSVGAAAPTVVAGDGVTIIPPKPLVGAASMLSSGHLQVVFDQL